MLEKLLGDKEWLGLMLLRLVAAFILIQAGLQKLGELGDTVEGFADYGIPLASVGAVLSALAEFVGGTCLALGLFSRWAAVFVSFNMLVAVIVTIMAELHRHQGPLQVRSYGFPLMVLAVALCIMLTGPGRASIDAGLSEPVSKKPR